MENNRRLLGLVKESGDGDVGEVLRMKLFL
jgi:hypothetical protein